MSTYEHNPNQAPAIPDRWTPILTGDVFCSPACGGKCTKAAYDRAVDAANALVAQLGHGWEPEVWENLGWHYAVQRGVVRVHAYEGKYEVVVNVEGEAATHTEDADPRKAVEDAKDILTTRVARLNRSMSFLSLDAIAIDDLSPERLASCSQLA